MDLYAYNCGKQLYFLFIYTQSTKLSCFTLHYGPTHARSDVNGDMIAVEDNAESLLLKISELAPVLCQEAHEGAQQDHGVCLCICVWVSVCVCVCLCVQCICIYIFVEQLC